MDHNQNIPSESEIRAKLSKRPRSPTLLNLDWLRERVMKMTNLREKINSGSYEVDAAKVARAMCDDP